MDNLFGLLASMAYTLLVIGIATLVAKFSEGATETSRKVVHILVGHWVFLTPLFTELWAVVLVPFTFILINSLSLKYTLIKAMERDDDSLGTVYYAVSLFVLSGLGFLLGYRALPYIGILTMAYGDGFAAITGKAFGKRKPFPFAKEKTLVGTLTVAFFAFFITALCLYAFQGDFSRAFSLPLVLFIAILTAFFSAFMELIGKRGCDNLTLPMGAGLFAVISYAYGTVPYFLYLLISLGVLLYAYTKQSITEDGMVAALLTAVTLYGLGGPYIGWSLILFFLLGTGVSKLKNPFKIAAEKTQEHPGPRNWKQVLANSLPAVILVWCYYFLGDPLYLFLSLVVFSAASADTFSSEIGMMAKGKVYHILTGKPLKNGVSGGVTLQGLLAGLLGSILLSIPIYLRFGLQAFFLGILLGILGSLLDSVLGATLQRRYEDLSGRLQDAPLHAKDLPKKGLQFISNNTVNLLSLTLVALIGYFLFVKS
ncbi:MAG TPA: DUF92 domain-containing protein [Clostridiaceae bacterium]|nr:DUF92 domain-containing protein [Clostridiaceae bacterium]